MANPNLGNFQNVHEKAAKPSHKSGKRQGR